MVVVVRVGLLYHSLLLLMPPFPRLDGARVSARMKSSPVKKRYAYLPCLEASRRQRWCLREDMFGSQSCRKMNMTVLSAAATEQDTQQPPSQYAQPVGPGGGSGPILVPQQARNQWGTTPPATGEKRFICPEPGCHMAYTSSVGLYQHKRSKHPWLIKQRPRREAVEGGDEEYRFVCPSPGCTKAYRTSMGLYQHKRTKHPWLIKQRERGYQRPAYRAGV